MVNSGQVITKSTLDSLSGATAPPPVPGVTAPPAVTADPTATYKAELAAANARLVEARSTIDALSVEIHKKFALSFACFVFVLFGPPIALRFPRGGVGVTIGVSIVVFGLYYVCLMAGEVLGDKGRLPAWVAMWLANGIFGLAGVVLLWRIEQTTDTSRGGGLRDWWHDRKVRRALRARSRAASVRVPASAGAA
jgi:lipopolysaccharide export system permease protein